MSLPMTSETMPRSRAMAKLVAALAIAGSIVAAGAGVAGAADPDVQKVLAPTGKLRVGLYPGTPTSILPDATNPRGVAMISARSSRGGLAFLMSRWFFPRTPKCSKR